MVENAVVAVAMEQKTVKFYSFITNQTFERTYTFKSREELEDLVSETEMDLYSFAGKYWN